MTEIKEINETQRAHLLEGNGDPWPLPEPEPEAGFSEHDDADDWEPDPFREPTWGSPAAVVFFCGFYAVMLAAWTWIAVTMASVAWVFVAGMVCIGVSAALDGLHHRRRVVERRARETQPRTRLS